MWLSDAALLLRFEQILRDFVKNLYGWQNILAKFQFHEHNYIP
jgi:hypothetical protein